LPVREAWFLESAHITGLIAFFVLANRPAAADNQGALFGSKVRTVYSRAGINASIICGFRQELRGNVALFDWTCGCEAAPD
jgi:hypothetical protein